MKNNKEAQKKSCLFTLIILCIFIVAFLQGCGNNKDYTKQDTDTLLSDAKINATFIKQEEKDGVVVPTFNVTEEDIEKADAETDTYYTYKDNTTGVEFQIVELHLLSGIDATRWITTNLYTNYGYKLSQHLLSEGTVIIPKERKIFTKTFSDGETMRTIGILYVFDTREDLKKCIEEYNNTLQQLRGNVDGCRLECDFTDTENWTWASDQYGGMESGQQINRDKILKSYDTFMSKITETNTEQKTDVLNEKVSNLLSIYQKDIEKRFFQLRQVKRFKQILDGAKFLKEFIEEKFI